MAVVIIMIKRMMVVEMEKVERLEKLVVKEILLQLVNF
jgi:hypothetical protein